MMYQMGLYESTRRTLNGKLLRLVQRRLGFVNDNKINVEENWKEARR